MATTPRPIWIDRAVAALAPAWGLRRQRARIAAGLLARHYEGAATGRRTQNWYRATTDANAALGTSLARLRDAARDLVRNNPYAASAVDTIANHTVGWGVVPTNQPDAWKAHAESTDIDADGRLDLYGLQKLVMRTVVTDGEVLVRRRWRRPEDGFALPFQLQVLEADYLDTAKDLTLPTGNRVVKGVEFDLRGRRVAYWLFREHPGATISTSGSALFSPSYRVDAGDVVHIFRPDRPGQVRGPSWFAPVLLRFKDHDEFEDATLMKQKIAACLSVITTDPDGASPSLGVTTTEEPTIDTLAPGMVLNLPPGRSVDVVNPPSVTEFEAYSKTVLRAIATGLGVSYEDLVGDYTGLPFSAARMSRLRHVSRVEDWRWRLLVPQFLVPLWGWAIGAAGLVGVPIAPTTEWTAPALPMVDPDKEIGAIVREVRSGLKTLHEAIRERGYDPEVFLRELQKSFATLDELGLVLDSDPRKMTQQGQAQSSGQPTQLPGKSASTAKDAEDDASA